MDIKSFLERLWEKYQTRIELEYDNSRRRAMVEMKAAFINSLEQVVHTTDVADLLDCDRTTIIHAHNQHKVYMPSSATYRHQYCVAVELVNGALRQLPPGLRFCRPGKGDIVQQIKQINQTIGFLNELKTVILSNGKRHQLYLSGDGELLDSEEQKVRRQCSQPHTDFL